MRLALLILAAALLLALYEVVMRADDRIALVIPANDPARKR